MKKEALIKRIKTALELQDLFNEIEKKINPGVNSTRKPPVSRGLSFNINII